MKYIASIDNDNSKFIGNEYKKFIKDELTYKKGLRNIFIDNSFTEEETIFFEALVSEFKLNSLNPSLIKLERLASGTWNVNYVDVCYVGKISICKNTYFIQYTLRVNDGCNPCDDCDTANNCPCNYYKAYMESETYNVNLNSVQDCINNIPKWIKYIKSCMSF